MSESAFGPGKVILLGEHAVVYGQPALAGALTGGVIARAEAARRPNIVAPSDVRGEARRRLEEAFRCAASMCGNPAVRISLESDLPVSMGLGSSAALSVACARVLLSCAGRVVDPRKVIDVAFEMERQFHGTPSGIDHTTSAMGGLILFRRRPDQKRGSVKRVTSQKPLKVLVALVAKRQHTKETISALRERMERWPKRYERLFREIGRVAEEGARAVEDGDLEALGDAMTVNHGLLAALGLASDSLDEMAYRLRRMGALGAKLTGAGGDGGAVVGLFLESADLDRAAARLRSARVEYFTSQLAGPLVP